MKNFGEKRAWVYPGTAQFFGVPPIISGMGKAKNFKFGRCIQSVHANKSPLKFGRIGSVGESRDSPIFGVPPIISGMGKATNFKLGRYIHSVHLNKSPLQILGENGEWDIQGLPKFFEYPLLSQEWLKLRTSNFVRTFLVSIGTKACTNFGKSSRGRL